MGILISWLQMKPADLDQQCFHKGKEFQNSYLCSVLIRLNIDMYTCEEKYTCS